MALKPQILKSPARSRNLDQVALPAHSPDPSFSKPKVQTPERLLCFSIPGRFPRQTGAVLKIVGDGRRFVAPDGMVIGGDVQTAPPWVCKISFKHFQAEKGVHPCRA